MKRVLKILGILLLLLFIVLITLPFILPVEQLQEEARARLEVALGRKITLQNMQLDVFPDIAFTADSVSIGSPDWAGEEPLVKADKLRIGVKLLPLLHKELHIEELALDGPVITLVQQKGKASWVLKEAPKEAKASASGPITNSATMPRLDIAKLIVKNGKLVWRDLDSRKSQTLDNINLSFKAPNLEEQLMLEGGAAYNGDPVSVSLVLKRPLTVQTGAFVPVDMALRIKDKAFSWKGEAALKDGKPYLKGKVEIPLVDLSTPARPEYQKAQTVESEGAEVPSEPAARFSPKPLPLEMLSLLDADMQIFIASLRMPHAALEQAQLSLRLQHGQLNLSMQGLNAYKGTVDVDIKASHKGSAAMKAAFKQVQMEPLLNDWANLGGISGVLSSTLDITMQGMSMQSWVKSLNGSGRFEVLDGEIKGKNLAAMASNLASSFQQNAQESTPFTHLSASYTLKDGVANNNDLKLAAPLIQATGAGAVDIPGWNIHYRLVPEMVLAAGAKTEDDRVHITVPVLISGPLDNPEYRPDVSSIIKDTLQNKEKLKENLKNVEDNVRGLRDQLKDKDALKEKLLEKDGLKKLFQ